MFELITYYLVYHFGHLVLVFPSLVIFWQVAENRPKTFGHYQFSYLTVDMAKRDTEETGFCFSFGLLPHLKDVTREQAFLPLFQLRLIMKDFL